jgi:phosphoglycerate kinase
MKIRTLNKVRNWCGKRVLLRVDFNIPVGKNGAIGPQEDLRIRAALPTIVKLVDAGAQVIIVSHLGRPEKREAKFSLAPIAAHLTGLLKQDVLFIADDVLKKPAAVAAHLADLPAGGIAVLENIRFYSGEEKNDPKLARSLAALADVYVNDAFGTAHRAHASTAGVTRHLPSYAGLLMEAELANLSRLLEKPKRPFVVVLGGAKISTKLPTIKKLLTVADTVLLGGGLANNFFKAAKLEVGKSLVDPKEVKLAAALAKNKKIVLPSDVLAATSLTAKAKARYCRADAVRPGEYIVDVGPETMRSWTKLIKGARTIVWNGPLGLFENPRFAHGSIILGRVVAARAKGAAFGIIGGGETIQCAERTGMIEFIDHVSTGGGAMLEFLSGKPLPGVKPLLEK